MTESSLKETLKNKMEEGSFAPEDLPAFFEVFSQLGNQIEDLQDEVKGWDSVVEFELTGSGIYWIAIADTKFTNGTGTHPGTRLRLIMSAEDAAAIFAGDKNAESALNAGELKLEGAFPDAVKLYDLLELVLEEIEY